MENIPKMKTVQQCFRCIKQLDSESAITEWFIRSLCKDNKVKHFMSGNKILVNYDDLLKYLNNSDKGECEND